MFRYDLFKLNIEVLLYDSIVRIVTSMKSILPTSFISEITSRSPELKPLRFDCLNEFNRINVFE